ncbi:MAG: tRNA dihydrouridine synthase DusB [Clostridia bacterium]|nr:tRNA dihydrouridine synthase DusB [Clostridia bacterium]
MYLKKLKIGNVELENNILLAPMAGITDLPFRKLCKENGCGLVETEMVSAKAIYYKDEKTLKMLNMEGEKRPVSIQIFGNDPKIMAEAVKILDGKSEIIDINMGCPAPKVVKNGEGSKLLLDLDLVGNIVKEVTKVSRVPVTVKIRKGWDNDSVVAIEAAKVIEKNGAKAITIHGRTRSEFYSGKADWNIIKEVKKAVNIPVIGNGDIVDEKTAEEIFKVTNVDGIMIGRATLGNPWIFKHIINYLKNGEILEMESNIEKLETIKRHFNMLLEEKGEYTAVREIRKHVAWYVKNMPESSKFKCLINKTETKDEFINTLEKFFKDNI